MSGREGRPQPPEARDDLVEDQQDPVLAGDRAETLEIALRRDQHARRARDRLHDHRRDRLGSVERNDPLELVGEVRAMFGLALRPAVLRDVGVRQVVDASKERAEIAAVVHDPADRDPAEAHAVIAPLATDQPRPAALAARPVIGERDLERAVDRLGARIGEEDMLEPVGREVAHPVRQFEGLGMAHLEGGRIVEFGDLLLHRFGDLRPRMARVAAPEPGGAVEDLPALGVGVVHVLGGHEHARRLLELPVGRERHPECRQVVRHDIPIERHDPPSISARRPRVQIV